MDAASLVAIDLAKNVFHLHGVTADGAAAFRAKLRRNQVLAFMASQPPCRVAMKACATAHWWARQLEGMGHSVVLIAPIYVKPFLKRQKNDGEMGPWPRCGRVSPSNDAEAIGLCGAAADHEVRGRQDRGPAGARWSSGPATCRSRQRTQTINASCHRHACGVTRASGRARDRRASRGREREAPGGRRRR